MTQQTIQIQPSAPTVSIQPPQFNGNDPFWVIIAISILVKAILDRSKPNK